MDKETFNSKPEKPARWWVGLSPVIIYILGWMTHAQLSLVKGNWPPSTAESTRAFIWFCILFAASSWFIFTMLRLVAPRSQSE